MKVAVNAYTTEYSGIGVMQRELYPRLEKLGVDLLLLPNRDPTNSPVSRYSSVLRASWLQLPKSAERFLSVMTPIPRTVSVPTTTIVYDLRWQRTRAGLGKLYRRIDLNRAVHQSDKLVAISERTAADARALYPNAKISVAHLGPGQVNPGTIRDGVGRNILLIGKADHKRNDVAVELIRQLPPDWFDNVIGVNLANRVAQSLIDAVGSERCELHDSVSTSELDALYRRSRFTLQLSVEEGFGLPFIEALAAGCVVVAIDQPLTRELLADAAILLTDGPTSGLRDQLLRSETPDVLRRQAVAERYSWQGFAENMYRALISG
jgi:glycosyltransferase involved in cell wall biosynthesis